MWGGLHLNHTCRESKKTRQRETREESTRSDRGVNASQGESKLELFGFDSLVHILGLKSITGEQIPVPRNGEGSSVTEQHQRVGGGLKLGTMMGVFIPCLQNILGIIYYIRFSWIVGIAGISQSLLLVALCGLCTFLTAISLSAIATNGAMKGGGPYYLIGRTLGPEVGVSIGLCFFLGNAVAGAMYVLGAVETFLNDVPKAGIFRAALGYWILWKNLHRKPKVHRKEKAMERTGRWIISAMISHVCGMLLIFLMANSRMSFSAFVLDQLKE